MGIVQAADGGLIATSKYIKLTNIHLPVNGGEVKESVVAALVDSIRNQGLINAITLIKLIPAERSGSKADEHNVLCAGRHRLEAYRQMGIEEIRFEYIEKQADRTVVEIDENLIRRELTKVEREALFNRKTRVLEINAADERRKLGKGGARKGAGRPAKGIEKQSMGKLPIDYAEPTPAQVLADEAGVDRRTVERGIAKTKMAEATFDEPTLSQFRASKLHTEKNVKRYHATAEREGKSAALAEFEADKLLAPKPKAEKTPKIAKPQKIDKPKPEKNVAPPTPVIDTLTLDDEAKVLSDAISRFRSRVADEAWPEYRERFERLMV